MKLIIGGASGAGKSTIADYLAKKHGFRIAQSYTTRTPRFAGESEYIFISKEEFESKIEENFFLEYERNYDDYYGTPASYTNESKIIFNVDHRGMKKLSSLLPNCVTIFISPPSKEELFMRLLLRGESNIESRLASFDSEHTHKDFYHYHIVNDNLITTYSAIDNILESCL